MLKRQPFLLIAPLIYLSAVFLLRHQFTYVYEFTCDPSYAYLFNGLNLAQGKLLIGHTDHPGTPVQILIALIIRVVNLFRGQPLVDDVLLNPEIYLLCVTISFSILIAISLYYLGKVALENNINRHMVFLLQCTPFISMHIILYAPWAMPEPLVLLFGIMALTQLIYFSTSSAPTTNRIIKLSIIIGLGMAVKINFIPVIILPLVIIKGIKKKVLAVLVSIATFIIAIIPALLQGNQFVVWVKSLISHSGVYGKGDKTFIDFHDFSENLINLLLNKTIPILFILVLFGYYFLWFFPKKKQITKVNRIIIGITFLGVIQLLLVAKHFRFHYFIPFEIFFIFALILLGNSQTAFLKLKNRLSLPQQRIITYLLPLILILNCGFKLDLYQLKPSESTKFLQTFSPDLNERVLTVLPAINNMQTKAEALYFGMVYSGPLRDFYKEKLYQLYPETCFYRENSGEFFNWIGPISERELLKQSDTLKIIFKHSLNFNDTTWLKTLSHEFKWDTACLKSGIISDSGQNYFIASYIPDKTNSLFNPRHLQFSLDIDFELELDTTIIINNGDTLTCVYNPSIRTSFPTRSMNNSIEMSPQSEYAIKLILPLQKNQSFKTSVWQYNSEYNGILVAELLGKEKQNLYGSVVTGRKDGWQQIKLDFDSPNNPKVDTLHIFLWYPNKYKGKAYFDDFRFEIWQN